MLSHDNIPMAILPDAETIMDLVLNKLLEAKELSSTIKVEVDRLRYMSYLSDCIQKERLFVHFKNSKSKGSKSN